MKKRKRSALIVGLGRFGTAAALRLVALGWEVVGVDLNADVVQSMRDRLHHVVQLDASDEAALATVGVSDFDVCIVSRGTSMESSILLVLNLQQLGAKHIVAKAASEQHARVLQRLGVQQIVFPERDAGHHLAESLQSPNLVEWIDLSENHELGAIRVPENRVGTRLRYWREIQRTPLRVLARLSPKGEPLPLDMDAQLGPGEVLVIVGPLQDILSMGK
jgi:trk system potassium uptake protein TrkA